MEKAILKTLIYSDIFDYPLQVDELHRWLIGRKVTLRQLEKALRKLSQQLSINSQGEYHFLRRRVGLTAERRRREKQSITYLRKAKILCQILKVVPWIKLVGISGGLALQNASKKDDIDLFIITGKNRLWISRLLALGLLSLTGQRRKVGHRGKKIAGKLCLNILLEEDRLEQKNKDIFVAHEILQMKPLWQRDGIYSRYLSDNAWAFKFLPNWVGNGQLVSTQKSARTLVSLLACGKLHFLFVLDFAALTGDLLEKLAKKIQLKIMQKPKGMERIEAGALYFHPEDCRPRVLSEYERRVKKLAPLDK